MSTEFSPETSQRDPLYVPIVRNPANMGEFRDKLAIALASKLVDTVEMQLAKLMHRPDSMEVTIVGLNPDDFHLELPSHLRVWAFKPVVRDKIPVGQWTRQVIRGFPLTVEINAIKGFQWIDPADEPKYIEHMVDGQADE